MTRNDESSGARPRLADRDVRLVLALTLAFQLVSWWRLEGYQLADSVEYIERAQGFLFGHEVLGPSSTRSFAFSALFLPFYWLVDRLGIEDARFLVPLFRVGTALLGLALCLACMRLGARVGGRRAGLWTGLLVGTNPIFLQYSISPVSGIAAALCVALGLERSLARGSLRWHFAGGLWLGVGFMMAYQTLPIAGSVVLALFLRDRWKHLRSSAGTLLGFVSGMLGQVAIDRWSYGEWGSSIFRYVIDNAGFLIVGFLGDAGFKTTAHRLYAFLEEVKGKDYASAVDASKFEFQSIQPTDWYLDHLPSALVWPVLALLALGVVRALRRPRWDTTLLLLCVALNLVLLNRKSSKSFRLWLPLFPFLFPLCAAGIELLLGSEAARGRTLRRLAFAALLVATPALGLVMLSRLDTRAHGVFWEATDWVNARIETLLERGELVRRDDPPVSPEGYGAGKVRISGSYHWAMFMRESPRAFLVKLPFEIETWDALDALQRQRNVDALATLDWYVSHWPALVNHPEWHAAVNELFTIEAAFRDDEMDPGLGALLVLRRKARVGEDADDEARTFLSRFRPETERGWRARHGFTTPVDFVETPGARRARLLGWTLEPLPGSDLSWLQYHWSSDLEPGAPWTIIDRLTSPDDENAWQNDHLLANGLGDLGALAPGEVAREGHLVVPGVDAYSRERPFRPFGGPHLRGDLIPTDLWLKLVRYAEDGTVAGELAPHDPASGAPLPTAPGPPTARGWRASPDGLVRVGRFLLPRSEELTRDFVPAEGP